MANQGDNKIAADRVFSVEEGIQLKKEVTLRNEAKRWRWMGNYGSPEDAAAVANAAPPSLAGEVMFTINGGLVPAWMFY
ncbi:hypothetical protein AB0F18_21355 [Streptomyces sp. NPDC029216]|uniref:hypothetical protein n=1 Tax=Streptomyces sp. NPDC029216 TaxID=3154701 RepID=UPI0033FA9772